MTNECEVYFGLNGNDFDPNDLSNILGIKPTRAKKKAEPNPKKSYWHLSSGIIVNDIIDVYKMSSDLIVQLQPYKEKIIEAKSKFDLDAYLEVVLWITSDESKSTPIIGFDSEVIQFLNDIKATIDIDTYRN